MRGRTRNVENGGLPGARGLDGPAKKDIYFTMLSVSFRGHLLAKV